MTPFTHLNTALEEADYLAAETRQRMALVHDAAGYRVIPADQTAACGLRALEIITPPTLTRRTAA